MLKVINTCHAAEVLPRLRLSALNHQNNAQIIWIAHRVATGPFCPTVGAYSTDVVFAVHLSAGGRFWDGTATSPGNSFELFYWCYFVRFGVILSFAPKTAFYGLNAPFSCFQSCFTAPTAGRSGTIWQWKITSSGPARQILPSSAHRLWSQTRNPASSHRLAASYLVWSSCSASWSGSSFGAEISIRFSALRASNHVQGLFCGQRGLLLLLMRFNVNIYYYILITIL